MVNRVLHLGTSWGSVPNGAGQFSNTNKSSHITLDGTYLIATAGASAGEGTNVFSYTGKSSGKLYAEFTLTTKVGASGSQGVGLGNSLAAPDNTFYLGETGSKAVGYWSDGSMFRDGQSGATGWPTYIEGDRINVAADMTDGSIFWRKNGTGNWNNNGAADPTIPTNGISFSFLGSAPYYLVVEGEGSGDVWTANFSGPFTDTPPTGFSAWG